MLQTVHRGPSRFRPYISYFEAGHSRFGAHALYWRNDAVLLAHSLLFPLSAQRVRTEVQKGLCALLLALASTPQSTEVDGACAGE